MLARTATVADRWVLHNGHLFAGGRIARNFLFGWSVEGIEEGRKGGREGRPCAAVIDFSDSRDCQQRSGRPPSTNTLKGRFLLPYPVLKPLLLWGLTVVFLKLEIYSVCFFS
jgi:hypothetical protein